MRVHRSVARLARLIPPLRFISPAPYPKGQNKRLLFLHRPLSASVAATSLILATDLSLHCHSLYQSSPSFEYSLRPLCSVRDIPTTLTAAITDAYSTVRSSVLRTVHIDGGLPVGVITAVNAAVYLMWKGAPTTFMVRYVKLVASSATERATLTIC